MRQSFDVSGESQPARDAAIAAMGQRLAAAGPRTRRKTPPCQNTATEPCDLPAPAVEPPPRLVADRSMAFIRDANPILPPSRHRRAMTTAGRAAGLACMAAAGFAVVLLAQRPGWSVLHRPAAAKIAVAESTATVQPDSPPLRLADDIGSSAGPRVAPALPAVSVAPALPQAKPASVPSREIPTSPVPPASAVPARPSWPMRVQLAAAPGQPRHLALASASVRGRHETLHAPVHPVTLAHYTLPRWLTEAPDTQMRQIVMSPQPHDLVAPAAVQPAQETRLAAEIPQETPRQRLPPLPRPKIVYASAGYAAPMPYGGYYGPGYPPAP